MELTTERLDALAMRISIGFDRDLAHELIQNIYDSIINNEYPNPSNAEDRVIERAYQIVNRMKEAKIKLSAYHGKGSKINMQLKDMRSDLESIGDSRLYTIRKLLGINNTYLLGCTEKNPFYCKIVAAFLLGV
jgi:hypothetical protein